MYKCNHCGEEFEVPRLQRYLMGEYFGDKAYENYEVCPRCMSEDWDEKRWGEEDELGYGTTEK